MSVPCTLMMRRCGQIVCEAMDDPVKYGKDAVRQLAEAVKQRETHLYEIARLARVVSEEEIRAHPPLTLHHWLILAREEDAFTRNEFAAYAGKYRLSVRELEQRMLDAAK